MAVFEIDMPEEVMRDLSKIYDNAEDIFKGTVKAGAETAYESMRTNVPQSFHNSDIMSCLEMTTVYKTPSDNGISCKVGFWGYFTNKKGKTVPAPLVVNVFEYGRSDFPKKPFFRKSFNKSKIKAAMLAEQKRLSGGILE